MDARAQDVSTGDVDTAAPMRPRRDARRLLGCVLVLAASLLGIVAVRAEWSTHAGERFHLDVVTRLAKDQASRFTDEVAPALRRGLDGAALRVGDLCMTNCERADVLVSAEERRAAIPEFGIPIDDVWAVVEPGWLWDRDLVTGSDPTTGTVDPDTIATLADRDIAAAIADRAAPLQAELRGLERAVAARTAVQWVLGLIAIGSLAVAERLTRPHTRRRSVDDHAHRAIV